MILDDVVRKSREGSASEMAIARTLLEQRDRLRGLSAHALAEAAHVSPSTVVRFCQRLGYAGYEAFRTAFMRSYEHLTTHFSDIDPNRPFMPGERDSVVAHRIGALYREIEDDTLDLIDEGALARATDAVVTACEVIICSDDFRADLAEGFRNKMLKIGRTVTIERRASQAYYRAAQAGPRDVAFILLSYTGDDPSLLAVARAAHDAGATTIAVTSCMDTALEAACDISLHVSTRERLDLNLGHFAMNVSTMLLLDILYACVFNRDPQGNYRSRVSVKRALDEALGLAGKHLSPQP